MHAHTTAVAEQHPTHLIGILSSPRPKLAVKEGAVQIMIHTIHQSGPAQPHCQATPILMLFSHSLQYGRVGVVWSETIPLTRCSMEDAASRFCCSLRECSSGKKGSRSQPGICGNWKCSYLATRLALASIRNLRSTKNA